MTPDQSARTIPQTKPKCDGCGEQTWEVRLVRVSDPDGVITTCDDCEGSLNSEIEEVLAVYE